MIINHDGDDMQLAFDRLLQDVMFLLWHVCCIIPKTLSWDVFGSCAALWN